ncbi:hypothetical protein EON65_46480 [archaeon]|nr:MAG: hypothetical protein EON65_46480 [archaeon]
MVANGVAILHPRRFLIQCKEIRYSSFTSPSHHHIDCPIVYVCIVDGFDQMDTNAPPTSVKNQVAGFLQAVRYLKGKMFTLPLTTVTMV